MTQGVFEDGSGGGDGGSPNMDSDAALWVAQDSRSVGGAHRAAASAVSAWCALDRIGAFVRGASAVHYPLYAARWAVQGTATCVGRELPPPHPPPHHAAICELSMPPTAPALGQLVAHLPPYTGVYRIAAFIHTHGYSRNVTRTDLAIPALITW